MKLPDGLQEFRVRGVPQAAPVEISAQLPDGGHELARSHFGDGLGQGAEGGEQLRSRVALTHNRSLKHGELARLLRYRPITTTGTVSPGASFAIRVARVTPSDISRTLSGSS
jgi:hypothetical protein